MKAPGNNTDIPGAMDRLLERFKHSVCAKYAADAEQKAKDNAPWTDQTKDARKMLKGYVIDPKEKVTLTVTDADGNITRALEFGGDNSIGFGLAHRKEYGKWLELANDGKYAILKPTIESLREGFFTMAHAFFGGS